jgi:hypothetical protein
MKKAVLLFIILTTACTNAFGQIKKDARLIGVNFNYSLGKNSQQVLSNTPVPNEDNINSTNFNGILRLGYFVTDRIAVGFAGGYGSTSSSDENKNLVSPVSYYLTITKQTNTSLTSTNAMGVFVRGYKLFFENKLGFFYDLSAVYQFGASSGNTRNEYSDGSVRQYPAPRGQFTGCTIGLRPGVVYFVTPKIGLEGSFGNFSFYSQSESFYQYGNKVSSSSASGLNLNLNATSFYLGVSFYL